MPSTVIKTFSYDHSLQRLRVVFQTGKVYDYLDVPVAVYNEMKLSFAKGIFFNERVKPNFKCKKVSD